LRTFSSLPIFIDVKTRPFEYNSNWAKKSLGLMIAIRAMSFRRIIESLSHLKNVSARKALIIV